MKFREKWREQESKQQRFRYVHESPSLFYTALGLIVQVQPTEVTVLDASPYNRFSLVCTASVPANVTSIKQFVWRTGGTSLTSGAGTTISSINLNSPVSTSTLSTNASSPGIFSYSCDVTVSTAQSSAIATVTVNGMSCVHLCQYE